MSQTYNVYCDESCHLEHDHQRVMVLGAIWCPLEKTRDLSICIRELRRKHGMADHFEIKWTKVSPAKLEFYLELLDLFFAEDALSFRSLVIPDKSVLRHSEFGQTHDHWYYKMYYLLLRPIPKAGNHYRVFLDIKDTQGARKARELQRYLEKAVGADSTCITTVQQVNSSEIALMQLADLLIGAVCYANRELTTSSAKLAIVDKLRNQTGLTLTSTTAPGRSKFDVFLWVPNAGGTA